MKEVRRCVSTGFWNDDKVLNDFSPEDKYFMLYLLTNPYTTQLGVYHLPLKKVALELGYSLEAVNTLLDRFENKYRIIKFNRATSEIAIKNYLKHSIIKGGKPVMDCLERDLKSVKDLSLVGYVFSHISDSANDTVHEFMNIHLDIKDKYNDNDNDNERNVNDSYHDSYHDSPKPKKTLKETATNVSKYLSLLDTCNEEYIGYINNNIEIKECVETWMTYKDEKKNKYQETSIKSLLKKVWTNCLESGNRAVISAIEDSMSNNYQGIVWDYIKKPQKQKNDIVSEWRNA